MDLHTKVEEVMRKSYPLVDKNDSIYHAVRLMDKYDSDRALVAEKGMLAGVITKKDIIAKLGSVRRRRLSAARMRVSSFMSANPITIEPDASVSEAARIMAKRRISGLPVVRGEAILGLITKWELLKVVEGDHTPISNVSVSLPMALRTTDTFVHASRVLTSGDLQMLPVIDDEGRVVGSVSIDEIAAITFMFYDLVPAKYRRERLHEITVSDFMRTRPLTLRWDAELGEAARLMLEKRHRGAIVMHIDTPTGLVTLDEVTSHIARSG